MSILWIFAGVAMALLVTTTGTLLANMDTNEVKRVARTGSALEVTYMALQFVVILAMSPHTFRSAIKPEIGCLYHEEIVYMAHAVFALLSRSFCELVIVSQLDRNRSDIFNTQRARDIMYGLFSIYLVWGIAFTVPDKSIEDPLVEKDKAAVAEIKRLVEEKIAEATNGGETIVPTIPSVLNSIEAMVKAQGIPPYAEREHFMKLEEIARLRKQYKDWEPVYKGSSNIDGQNEVIELVKKNKSVERT